MDMDEVITEVEYEISKTIIFPLRYQEQNVT